MNSTQVFLTGILHLSQLIGAVIALYLAWEVRRRPSRWLLASLFSIGLALGVREAGFFLHLYSESGISALTDWRLALLVQVLDAASLASFVAWAIDSAALHRRWQWVSALTVAGGLYMSDSTLMRAAAFAAAAYVFAVPASGAQRHAIERRFFRNFAFAVGIASIALLLPVDQLYRQAIFALLSLGMPLTLLFWIATRNVFGLKISRQFVFVLTLSLLSALYLLVVKRLSDQLFLDYGQSRSFVEVLLIMAAALFWLPLYEWMSRRMARRSELLADFSKKVIEQAAAIADADEQIQFLASGLAKTLDCRRLLLISLGEIVRQGSAGAGRPLPPEEVELLLKRLAECWDELVHQALAPPDFREWMELHGFHYLLPLRHEARIAGVLLLDVSPRRYLADIDSMFPSVGREISLLLVSARLAEQKLEMEKALVAQESRAVIGDLTASIVHEIKNPLSNIRALSQLIREDASVRQQYERDLDFIIHETDRLNASVMQLLEFAKQPAGELGEVDVSALLERAIRNVEVETASSHLCIDRDFESDLRLPAADPRGVEQIVMNLLRNALQASPERGRIRITARRRDGAIQMSFCDQGPGIPEELHEKIFQPYFTTKQSGTGLGLAIVMRNLRQMHGTLELRSPCEDGHGTEFLVALPGERR